MTTMPIHYTGFPCGTAQNIDEGLLSSEGWDLVTCRVCMNYRVHVSKLAELHRTPYTYKGDTGCLLAVMHDLSHDMNHPMFNFADLFTVGTEPEAMRDIAAEMLDIEDVTDLTGYDSDIFPKPVARDAIDPEDFCAACMVRYSDGAQMRQLRLFGTGDIYSPDKIIVGVMTDMESALLRIPGGPDLWECITTAATLAEALETCRTMTPDKAGVTVSED